MAFPHPALIDLAAGRALPEIEDHWKLLKSAQEHRMTGLLWSRVLEGELTADPEWRETVAWQDVLIRARNRRLWETLAQVTANLGERGIEVAAIKGVRPKPDGTNGRRAPEQ